MFTHNMQKILVVMSGKGGVGKTSVSVIIARILAETHRVVLLDFDICGPSVTAALGVSGALVKTENGFTPVSVCKNLDVLSFGSILEPNDVVIWRGPKKRVFLNLFLNSTADYDYIVVDTPPGISEEHLFFKDKPVEVFVVTTPQNISLNDTQRCIEFCLEKKLKIIGIIENMAEIRCECCSVVDHPFGSKGGAQLASEYHLDFLASLPIDVKLEEMMDSGSFVLEYTKSESVERVRNALFSAGIYNKK